MRPGLERIVPVTIKPTQPVPELDVATLDGERFRLSERSPDAFTMIVFYRGLHVPSASRISAIWIARSKSSRAAAST
jgi:hypothetical protein